jgi:hypothetical protein
MMMTPLTRQTAQVRDDEFIAAMETAAARQAPPAA